MGAVFPGKTRLREISHEVCLTAREITSPGRKTGPWSPLAQSGSRLPFTSAGRSCRWAPASGSPIGLIKWGSVRAASTGTHATTPYFPYFLANYDAEDVLGLIAHPANFSPKGAGTTAAHITHFG